MDWETIELERILVEEERRIEVSNRASAMRSAVVIAYDIEVINVPTWQWDIPGQPAWVDMLRPYFNLTMHQLTLMID